MSRARTTEDLKAAPKKRMPINSPAMAKAITDDPYWAGYGAGVNDYLSGVPKQEALDSAVLVRLVLVEAAKRGIFPTWGPSTIAKAREAAGRLLRTLEIEDSADHLAPVVDLEARRFLRAEVRNA